ncbi:hypothetical protein GIB67_030850 [Kingdonia uniflora]|uniref:Uncharacterized protein n=1 Tax=Kingdonia uniflora TaxID=39325 RepID=A0A7J7L375_9MAGN|nr:hypothetical protein GIB67_030850 [Kingdonia uniflora]
MPAIIACSISILSDAGLGMAILSLGMFMVLQLCIITSGNKLVDFTIYHGFLRFLVGLAVIALTSIALGL